MLITTLSAKKYEEERLKYVRKTPRKLQKIRSKIWNITHKFFPTTVEQQVEMPEILSENKTLVRKLKKDSESKDVDGKLPIHGD